jgi:hypothetical protein
LAGETAVLREISVLVPPCISQNFMHYLRAFGDEKRVTNRVGYDRDSRVITVTGTTRVTTMTETTEL